MLRRSAGLLTALLAIAAPVAAQPSSSIEFQRDVQPIFRDRCGSCHGPEMQRGGLRLDRRTDALRGGTQTDIGPGNAEGSRLYHRLIGTAFGQEMAPGTPLSAADAETIKRWIDEGAKWPDEASGEAPAPPIDPDAARLIASIRAGDRQAIDDLLRTRPRAVAGRGAAGVTPLMAAALYGDAALEARLLEAGADPDAADVAGATALMWAVPDTATLGPLLDAGADVNARTDDRRTALIVASSTVGATPAVRLLLDYGADAWTIAATDASPLREAARVNDPESFALLLEYGVRVRAGEGWTRFLRTNCIACAKAILTIRPSIESNDVEATAMSLRALQLFARPSRRADDDAAIDRARAWLTTAPAEETEERAFRLLGLSWAKAPAAAIQKAARDLLAAQQSDGGWAQLKGLGSDAYASGEALVALRESGAIDPANRAYRTGLEYLLRTQIEDGSWLVETRAVPIQAYFESGFPFGVNQWISAAATG